MEEKNENNRATFAQSEGIWWTLPFDATTNFSLLGYLLGGLGWEYNPKKKVDMTLNNE